MKIKIVIGIFFVSSMLLMTPSISAIQLLSGNQEHDSTASIKTDFSRYVEDLSIDIPPPWFTFFHTFIMISLNARILMVTPLAITPGDDFWGDYDINSYAFFFLLLTLVYRFAFWYTFLHKIAENHNWDVS